MENSVRSQVTTGNAGAQLDLAQMENSIRSQVTTGALPPKYMNV
jgi:hypothetical protein